MSGQAPVNSDKHPSRRTEKLLAASAGVYVLGLLFLSGAWKMADMSDQELGVIIFFVLGIVSGVMSGIFLGQALYLRLRLKPGSLVPFAALAILNVIVFALLGKPTAVVDPGFGDLLVNALCLVGAPVLLAANAYLLGFFFLPGRQRISGTRRMILIPILYGSLALGILLGWNIGLWQRGRVPIELLEQPQQLPRKYTIQEAIREFDKEFPPNIEVDESKPGVVALSASPEIAFQSIRNHIDFHSKRRVIEASGSVAIVNGERVEIRGSMTFAGENLRKPEGTAEDGGKRRSRGRPFPGLVYSDWEKEEFAGLPGFPTRFTSHYPWAYTCAFLVLGPENFAMSDLNTPELRPPGGGEVIGRTWTGGGGSWWTEHALRIPMGGPAQLRLPMYDRKDRMEHTIPAREGETLSTATNRVLLAGIYPWQEYGIGWSRNELELSGPDGDNGGRGSPAEPGTTIVLYSLAPRALAVKAVLRSGQTMVGPRRMTEGRWSVYRISAQKEEIEKLIILGEPAGFEVVFHIPELQGLPPKNDDITDRLDISLPEVSFTGTRQDTAVALLASILSGRFRPERGSVAEQVPGHYENITIRDLLDLCYPRRWWVKNGVVHTTNNRLGPILWRVKEALRELREG
jgi:hypothetical protein